MNQPDHQKGTHQLWQVFSRTGRIEAYLAYSAAREGRRVPNKNQD